MNPLERSHSVPNLDIKNNKQVLRRSYSSPALMVKGRAQPTQVESTKSDWINKVFLKIEDFFYTHFTKIGSLERQECRCLDTMNKSFAEVKKIQKILNTSSPKEKAKQLVKMHDLMKIRESAYSELNDVQDKIKQNQETDSKIPTIKEQKVIGGNSKSSISKLLHKVVDIFDRIVLSLSPTMERLSRREQKLVAKLDKLKTKETNLEKEINVFGLNLINKNLESQHLERLKEKSTALLNEANNLNELRKIPKRTGYAEISHTQEDFEKKIEQYRKAEMKIKDTEDKLKLYDPKEENQLNHLNKELDVVKKRILNDNLELADVKKSKARLQPLEDGVDFRIAHIIARSDELQNHFDAINQQYLDQESHYYGVKGTKAMKPGFDDEFEPRKRWKSQIDCIENAMKILEDELLNVELFDMGSIIITKNNSLYLKTKNKIDSIHEKIDELNQKLDKAKLRLKLHDLRRFKQEVNEIIKRAEYLVSTHLIEMPSSMEEYYKYLAEQLNVGVNEIKCLDKNIEDVKKSMAQINKQLRLKAVKSAKT